ncbi:MAG TPA: tyrosine-type recombinase/integrase [Streptosporangiaceae bacterium]
MALTGAPDVALATAIGRYLDHLVVERGLSSHTLAAYRRDLSRYRAVMSGRGKAAVGEVTPADVAAYLALLRQGGDGRRPLAASSAARAVAAVRGMHAFAAAEGLAVADPADQVRPPAPPRRLPRAIGVAEVERLIDAAGAGTEADVQFRLRDRALLEMLYGTGARISEAVGLDVDDLGFAGPPGNPPQWNNPPGGASPSGGTPGEGPGSGSRGEGPGSGSPGEGPGSGSPGEGPGSPGEGPGSGGSSPWDGPSAGGSLEEGPAGGCSQGTGSPEGGLPWDDAVRNRVGGTLRLVGKGGRERIVPVGSYARDALEAYLIRARPALAAASRRASASPALFLNARGGRLTRQGAWGVIQAAARRAGLAGVSPHTLRHSFATHLLDGGADVRVVQELLGHASVTTTQVYTLVTVDKLREVYAAAHPRAR